MALAGAADHAALTKVSAMDASHPSPPTRGVDVDPEARGELRFLRRVLITLGVGVLALASWQVREALLVAFAGIIVSVALLGLARPIEGWTGLARTWSLVLVLGALGLLLAGGVAFVGGEVRDQVGTLADRLPEAERALEERFGVRVPAPAAEPPGQAPSGTASQGSPGVEPSLIGTIAGSIAQAGAMVLNAASSLLVAIIGGVFFALDPKLYQTGLARLLPRSQQERALQALDTSGRALLLWLKAQLVSMAAIAVLSGLGMWWIGLPSPLALALFAGLTGFIPLLGGFLGAVPALLLALTQGGEALLWTAGLFLAVQQVESNMITPLVEKRLVSMPPALLLFAVVAFGTLLGLPGVLLAAPLTVVAYVLVAKLYLRETLGQEVQVPGEKA